MVTEEAGRLQATKPFVATILFVSYGIIFMVKTQSWFEVFERLYCALTILPGLS